MARAAAAAVTGWTLRLLIGLAGLLVVAGAALVWADWQWQQGTHALRGQLNAARAPLSPTHFDRAELAALPAPVQRYLGRVLREGQPLITQARFTHSGSFNMGQTTPQWSAFSSDQLVTTRRPGFDWDGRIAMGPGLSPPGRPKGEHRSAQRGGCLMCVYVHDAYVAGVGLLVAKPMGLFAVANVRGTPEVAQGELMRYLAETPWYPSALLPSQGVRWLPIDDRHARARSVGDRTETTPWQVRMWNYAERGGVTIPLEGEVAWLLPAGPYPYWRSKLETINYEPAD